jgi:hypothetical protein
MKSVKQQFIDLKEGKMTQAQFMRNIRMSLPQYVTNVSSFEDTIKILKNKAILNEADIKDKNQEKLEQYDQYTYTLNGKEVFPELAFFNNILKAELDDNIYRISEPVNGVVELNPIKGKTGMYTEADIYGIAGDPEAEAERKSADIGIKPTQTPEEKYGVDKRIDQFELNFLKKMYSKTPTEKLKKMIDDLEQRMSLNESYTTNTSGKELYSKFSEINNLNGQEVLIGIDYEMIKNCDLTKNEATKIVIKNLKKNPIYYTAQDMSAVENYELKYIGGKSANAEARRMQPYAADKVIDKKMGMQLVKGVEKVKASSNKAHKETNKPEGTIKMMSLVAKSSRGVKKMDATGEKMKKLALKENQDVDLNTLNNMLNNHDWYFEMSDDERAYSAGKAMETKLQTLARKLGQEGVNAYNDVQSKIFPTKSPLTLEKPLNTFKKIKSNEPSNPKLDALRDKISKMIMKEYSRLAGGDNMTDTAGHMMDTSTNNDLFEVKASSLSIGDKFKMAAGLGKFVMGEEVEVSSIEPFGNDIKLVLSNGKDKDDFYLDRNN